MQTSTCRATHEEAVGAGQFRGTVRRIVRRMAFASVVSVTAVTAFTIEELGAVRHMAVEVKAETQVRAPSALQAQVANLVNETRRSKNLPALIEDPMLDNAAQVWADHLAAIGRLEHTTDLAGGMGQTWLKLGENIGRGGSIAVVNEAWLNSPHHLENFVDPGFDAIGVGITQKDGSLWIVQRFRQTTPNVASGYPKPTDPNAPSEIAKPKSARQVAAGALASAR
jgi:uncharacterized protein YkwD